MAKLTLLSVCAVSALVPQVAAAQIKACKNASIVYGTPDYTGGARPASGASAKGEPPLAFRHMVFSGKNVYTNNGQEVWATDLATSTLRLVAGQTAKGLPGLAEGPCALARFVNINGITALPDGSLVVADNQGAAILKIANPDDPAKCLVSFIAGVNKPIPVFSNTVIGDKDGPLGTSALGLPMWPIADAAGNVYFIDGNTFKVKKIAPDEAHTVSTLAALPKDQGIQTYRGMTLLKDKLYATTNNFATGFIFEIDPSDGSTRKVLAAEGKHLPELGGSQSAAFSGITNDGKDLFVTGSGFIWRVTTAGKTSFIAGAPGSLSWPKGYDPNQPHAPKDIILRYRIGDQSSIGSTAAIAYYDGALYFRGKSESVYVVKIDCK